MYDPTGERAAHHAAEIARARVHRRDVLRLAAASLPLVACGPAVPPSDARSHTRPRIAVIGAGLAGLVCAHRLQQAGVSATLYEASSRVGGRVRTARGRLANEQLAELGGELVDSGHHALRGLASELGLALDDLTPEPGVVPDAFYFGGRHVAEVDISNAFRPIARQMQLDLAAARRDPRERARLDRFSIKAWLDAQSELDRTLGKLLEVAYVGEYGREADDQSAFNLLQLIDSVEPSPFRVFGESDERFHLHLGSDELARRLATKLHGSVQLGHVLTRVRQRDRSYRLSFDRAGGAREVEVDALVLALPFTLLRAVDLDLTLPALKRTMISELGYGTNTKLIGQYESRVWLERQRMSGSSFSDLSPQTTWDSSRGQPGTTGVLTILLGGFAGVDANGGTPEAELQSRLPELDQIFPGARAAYRKHSALRMHWPSARFALGSYACYRPGQARWSGKEGERVGRLHFCGEHTSSEFQGYMEGAIESGERVAREILADLGRTRRPVPGEKPGPRTRPVQPIMPTEMASSR